MIVGEWPPPESALQEFIRALDERTTLAWVTKHGPDIDGVLLKAWREESSFSTLVEMILRRSVPLSERDIEILNSHFECLRPEPEMSLRAHIPWYPTTRDLTDKGASRERWFEAIAGRGCPALTMWLHRVQFGWFASALTIEALSADPDPVETSVVEDADGDQDDDQEGDGLDEAGVGSCVGDGSDDAPDGAEDDEQDQDSDQ